MRYIKICRCTFDKLIHQKKQSYLQSLSILKRLWGDLSMNFIIALPPSPFEGKVYRHIMIIINRLIKFKRFISLANLDIQTII